MKTATPARSMRILARTILPNGDKVLALSVSIAGVVSEYAVTLGKFTARWRKTAQTPEGRVFHDAYVVKVGMNGPCDCSCPDRFYRGGVCKHMAATAALAANLANKAK